MPTTDIDYTEAHDALNLPSQQLSANSCVVSTPFGLSIVEIQGELNIPTNAPQDTEGLDPEYVSNFARVDDIYEAVRFGKMDIDEKNPAKVVLFVGKSQRLLGSVESLPTPLGVLRVPVGENTEGEKGIQIIDVIHKKIIFKQRPLPIM